MFFVSEEFLRKYQEGAEITQTIDEAVKPGEGLFEHHHSTADHKRQHRASTEAS